MASNHTEHFSLNQWLPDDQVKRTDFNEDNAKLDAALDALSGGLAEKAGQAALDALAAEVEKKATTAALEAVRAAMPKIAVGTYTGTGTYGDSKPCTLDLTHALGREPQLVLVRRQTDPGGRTKCLTLIRGAAAADCYNAHDILVDTENLITWTGKRVSWYGESASVQMNESGVLYTYFALG
ncbi:hypothetical protein [uncultured Intestinimonas sp.]|uniref:hypothetical protein n=1 Tax=uncultured Intestinimonas sp. TaxID=1689265 RepID=UPI0012AB5F83|nr:hypothetical protein [uncultured Intestinimonas sp.]